MDEDFQPPYEMQASELSEEEIERLVQSFITPDGTDSDLSESARQAKERQVRKQIASGSLKVINDPGSEVTMLMGSQEWRAIVTKLGL